MNVAITGLSQSGKSALLSAFLGADTSGSRKNVGIVKVPDTRLDRLSALYKPKKTVHTTITFEDCHSLDVSQKQDRVKLYERLKVSDAIVVAAGAYRCGSPEDLLKEINKCRFELIMSDLDFVTKRLERLDAEIKKIAKNRAEREKEIELADGLRKVLEEERFVGGLEFDSIQMEIMANYNLLTTKPICYVINVDEKVTPAGCRELEEKVRKSLESHGDESPVMALNPVIEAEVASLEPEDMAEFLKEYGIDRLGRDLVINQVYTSLNLLTFFTVGEDECRSWTIRTGQKALDAAGAIHSDLARGFIRAEVIEWDTLLELGSIGEAKKAGKMRLEGKTYTVKDGEIIHVMFNV